MTTSNRPVQPSFDEVMAAIAAGYHAIDGAEDFWDGFEGFLAELGYRRVADAPCTCPDLGRRGHMPECRWLAAVPDGH